MPDKRKPDPQDPAGRLNLFLGKDRKYRFRAACGIRAVGMTEAITAWMDKFIADTPGVPEHPPKPRKP